MRALVVPDEEAMFELLSALNISGHHPELPCVLAGDAGGPGGPNPFASPFLATLTDPDADHVNYIYSDESGRSRCVIGCDNCGTSGRDDDWTPRYPVTALLAVEPNAARAREDQIDTWWVAPAAPTEARGLAERVAALAEIIWHTSRADEGTISATGANIVARALLDAGYTPGDSLACCPECGSVFETEDNTVVCDHAPEVSAKRLAEAAAPETEGPAQTLLTAGAVPFADETGHGFEIDLTSAQPAAEGAREDDGLATAIELAVLMTEADCASAEYPFSDLSRAKALLPWLAEDRRRARAEGGAEALEEAADDLLLDCSHFNRYRGKPEWCGYCESAVNMLRDRAAGLRETGA